MGAVSRLLAVVLLLGACAPRLEPVKVRPRCPCPQYKQRCLIPVDCGDGKVCLYELECRTKGD